MNIVFNQSTIGHKDFKILQPKLLLVEGEDDLALFMELLGKLKINNIQAVNYKGKDRLNSAIKTLVETQPGMEKVNAIGITRDADGENISKIFEEINNYVNRVNYLKSDKIMEFSQGKPRVGIYIFPDCENSGELEDLLLASLVADQKIKCIGQLLTCINTIEQQNKPAKAKLYAWMACQNPPIQLLGVAAKANVFNFGHPVFEKLRQFLDNLSSK